MLVNIFSCLVLFYISDEFSLTSANPTIKISEGWLEGLTRKTDKGTPYDTYLGIPFAKPPVENLRFQSPFPPESWNGVRTADKEGEVCISYGIESRQIQGDEDCLYLNVYLPSTSSQPLNAKYPVLVFIHMGGFVTGNTNDTFYDPTWFVDEGLVVVTINYRLSAFGFLSLDIAEAPGNAGLKDQVAALSWIRKNIAVFGGDPDNVTLLGQSSGAASIHYLILSDISKGLFHKAIMSSGSALNPWAQVDNPKQNAFRLCEALGYHTNIEHEALQFLLNVPAYDLLAAIGVQAPSDISKDPNINANFRDIIFLPNIEKVFAEHIPIITEGVRNKMEAGAFHNIPVMVGYNNGEGLTAVRDSEEDPEFYGLIDANFERYIPKEMCLEDGSIQARNVANRIREFYYGNEPVDERTMKNYIEIKGDTWFKHGINDMVRFLAKHSSQPVYYYKFSFYEPGLRFEPGDISRYHLAGHADNLIYLLNFHLKNLFNNPRSAKTVGRMIQLHANFAKTGNPTPYVTNLIPLKWTPVRRNKLNYFSIDEELQMLTDPDKRSMQFWRQLIENENNC